MTENIYLTIDRAGVRKMTKNIPSLRTGEFLLKVEVEVAPEAFRNPILTKKVIVNDWREGIDIADVEFKETFISEDEAKLIKANRIKKMKEILISQGFTVTQEGEQPM